MEEKYSHPHKRFQNPRYIVLSLLSSLLIGIGLFSYMVPIEITERFIGSLAKPVNEYAIHIFILAAAIWVINLYTTYKSANKGRQPDQ
ncbi:MAG: hypothetical protein KBT55_08105 [Porticoccus sp.]|nr:hypothetical protein [Porticoccus sp.]